MKNIKYLLSTLVPAVLGIVALVLVFILDGAIKTKEADVIISTITTTSTVSMMGLIFGSPVVVKTVGNSTTPLDGLTGGMSTLGIISFVLLIIGILVTGYSFTKKKAKSMKLIGNVILVVSGVLMFFLLTLGADIVSTIGSASKNTKFVDFYEGYKLATGAIAYAILAIVGGGLGLFVTVTE